VVDDNASELPGRSEVLHLPLQRLHLGVRGIGQGLQPLPLLPDESQNRRPRPTGPSPRRRYEVAEKLACQDQTSDAWRRSPPLPYRGQTPQRRYRRSGQQHHQSAEFDQLAQRDAADEPPRE
jgi:hypothetical protein